jgi:hypothetical protein
MGHVFLILELVNKVHDVVVLNFHQPYLFVNFIVWVIRNDQSEVGSTLWKLHVSTPNSVEHYFLEQHELGPLSSDESEHQALSVLVLDLPEGGLWGGAIHVAGLHNVVFLFRQYRFYELKHMVWELVVNLSI